MIEKKNLGQTRALKAAALYMTGSSVAFEICIKDTQFGRRHCHPALRRSAPCCCQRHNSIWKESHIYQTRMTFMTPCLLYCLSGQRNFSRELCMKSQHAHPLTFVFAIFTSAKHSQLNKDQVTFNLLLSFDFVIPRALFHAHF